MNYVTAIFLVSLSLPSESPAFDGTPSDFEGHYTLDRQGRGKCSATLDIQSEELEVLVKGEDPLWNLLIKNINQGPTYQRETDSASAPGTLRATEAGVVHYPNRTELLVLTGNVKSESQPLGRGRFQMLRRYRSSLELSVGEFNTDAQGFIELHSQNLCIYR